MAIIRTQKYLNSLKTILLFISNDSKQRAIDFHAELNKNIDEITFMPYKHKRSNLADDESIRDLVFKGYVLVFKVIGDDFYILNIYKHNKPSI